MWTVYGPALRAPIGPLRWAGTKTSPVWCGKMERAVRSGHRAVRGARHTGGPGLPSSCLVGPVA